MVAIVSGNSLGLSNSSAALLGQNGLFGNTGNAANGKTGEGAFLNIATGNLILQGKDDFVGSRGGTSQAMTRTYNAQGMLSGDGDNNDNWKLGLNKRVNLTSAAGTVNTAGSTVKRIAE